MDIGSLLEVSLLILILVPILKAGGAPCAGTGADFDLFSVRSEEHHFPYRKRAIGNA
jgi:hypothetical protein